MAAGDTMPDGLMDEVAGALDALEQKMGKQLGDVERPAARVGALGRAVLDARDDGHRPQPRAQRHVGAGAREADRQRALRVRLVPPLRADVRQDRARHPRRRRSSTRSRSCARQRGVETDPELSADDLRELVETFKGIVREQKGIEFPQDPKEQLELRDRGGVPLVERRRAPRSTASWRTSPTTSAPRSTCRRWCSATRATTPAPASRSRATPPPARTAPTATSSRNAQGEDVVAGIRITEPLDAMAQRLPRVPPAAARR